MAHGAPTKWKKAVTIDDKYKFRVRRTANNIQSELKRRAPVWIRGTWSTAFHVECTAINF